MAFTLTPGSDENQRALSGTGGTRNLQVSSGVPAAILSQSGNQAQSIANSTPSAQFGLALMQLLQRHQQLGTGQFATQGYNAQTEQNSRISAQTPSSLVGASPGLQNSVRTQSANALNPTIQGANQGAQTFSEQISGLGSAIGSARQFLNDYNIQQDKARDDARNLIQNEISQFGSAAFVGDDPKEVAQILQTAGYPKDYIDHRKATLKQQAQEAAIAAKRKSTPGGDGGISATAQAVIDGVLRLEDLTPTVRGQIAGELSRAGYKSGAKLSATQQDELATMDTVSHLIQKLFDYNSDNKLEGVGVFQGTVGALGTKLFGTGSEEAKSVRAIIGNIKGTIAKLRGGTSFTPNEEALLNSYVPSSTENSQSALNKLRNLQEFIATKRSSLLSVANERGVPATTGGSDYNAYLKAIGR